MAVNFRQILRDVQRQGSDTTDWFDTTGGSKNDYVENDGRRTKEGRRPSNA